MISPLSTSRPASSIGIFGYGSLVNIASLEQTIGRQPLHIDYVTLQGWSRDWSVVVANNSPRGRFYIAGSMQEPEHILALNIRKNTAAGVNGIIFDATPEDIAQLDGRETHYERVEVTKDIAGEHSFDIIYTYIGKSKYLATPDVAAIIPQSYVHTVKAGFDSIHMTAYESFLSSTMPSNFAVTPTEYVLL